MHGDIGSFDFDRASIFRRRAGMDSIWAGVDMLSQVLLQCHDLTVWTHRFETQAILV